MEMRVTLYRGNYEVQGKWRLYDLAALLKDSEAFAENGTAFTWEFRKR